MLEEDDDGGVDLYGLMQARLGAGGGVWAGRAGGRLLVHTATSLPTDLLHTANAASTSLPTDTQTHPQCYSQQDKKAKSIQDRQIPKWQYNKFTLYQCFKPHQWYQRHTQCLQKKIFIEYQSITQVRHSMVFFVKTLSVLLWKSWKMIHQ